jgi:hypothetical protein
MKELAKEDLESFQDELLDLFAGRRRRLVIQNERIKSVATTLSKNEYYTADKYTLIQLMPADGWIEVYVQERDDGTVYFEATKPDFLALANQETFRYSRSRPGKDGEKIEEWRVIVGVTICEEDGTENIGHDDSNFAGLARDGSDITKIRWHLSDDLIVLIKATEAKGVSLLKLAEEK